MARADQRFDTTRDDSTRGETMSMSMSPVGNGVDPTNGGNQDSFRTRMQQTLGAVANLFGETTDQLQNELQSGDTSLAALAASKGVSQTDLVNTIQQSLQSSTANGTQLTATQLTNIANRIANHKHGGGHHHHHADATESSSATSSTDQNGVIQTDIRQLISDLQAAAANNGASNGNTNTSTDPTTTADSELLSELNRFDQSM
jgi:hypothetical protein